MGATVTTGSGLGAGVAGTTSWTAGFVSAATALIGADGLAGPPAFSSCNFARDGLIGVGTVEITGTASLMGGVVSLASRA